MSFSFEATEIADVVLVRTTRYEDHRGSFSETFRRSAFAGAGLPHEFVQDNVARSGRHVLRGLHYQLPPAAQGKLVRPVSGRIWDVAVDLRPESPTFRRWVGRILDGEEGVMLWVPEGFAHGYVVLSEAAEVAYKVTAEYAPELDRGVRWDDPALGIKWPVAAPVLSDKDRALPALREAELPVGP